MEIVWDEAKRLRNFAMHGFDFADVRDRFEWGTAVILPTYPGRLEAKRFTATGFLDGDLVTLVFGPLGTQAIACISLRRASRKERNRYGQS